ncbi:hypothetical protein [Sulfitobacter sp. W074]|uniref:hypothetical protein n=1 Tax=Sulfitobacter sp. W074 TaxID=2867026 RepID=UPI0021A5A43A|nr:hypothetical protein [Sulfitobacter sp. W074]UWR38379.1 hypothetical protein K3762_04930 [Sulfitobacter sp. W074]
MSSLGIDIDHILMGHYHQSICLADVTVGVAMKGPDEYAMNLLRTRADDPSQMLMLVHPEVASRPACRFSCAMSGALSGRRKSKMSAGSQRSTSTTPKLDSAGLTGPAC